MSIALQKQIRDNSEDIRGCLDDLYKWTTEMSSQESNRNGTEKPVKAPIRGAVSLEKSVGAVSSERSVAVSSEKPVAAMEKPSKNLTRDKTNMKEYYRAWDNFDVDAEEEKIEKASEEQKAQVAHIAEQKRTTCAKPNMKVQLRSSVRAKTDEDFAMAKKDEANKLFTQQRLREARDTYSQALTHLKYDCDLRATLLANRAMCHLKLNDFVETLKDTAAVLDFDPSHVKARFRKAISHSKLRQWKLAHQELTIVVEQDADDKKAQSELAFVTRMVNEEILKRREHAKRLMTYKRPISMPLRRIHIEERRGESRCSEGSGERREVSEAEARNGVASAAPLRLVTTTESKRPYVIRSLRATSEEGAGTASASALPRAGRKANVTFYDFERRWRAEKTPDERWQLLNKWDLSKLCRESFSSELLVEIIEACAGRENAHSVLVPLQEVRRWNMAYAGLTREERAILGRLMVPGGLNLGGTDAPRGAEQCGEEVNGRKMSDQPVIEVNGRKPDEPVIELRVSKTPAAPVTDSETPAAPVDFEGRKDLLPCQPPINDFHELD